MNVIIFMCVPESETKFALLLLLLLILPRVSYVIYTEQCVYSILVCDTFNSAQECCAEPTERTCNTGYPVTVCFTLLLDGWLVGWLTDWLTSLVLYVHTYREIEIVS